MSSITLQFGFNVPRKVIYDAFVDTMYFLSYLGKSLSTRGPKLKCIIAKVVVSPYWMAG